MIRWPVALGLLAISLLSACGRIGFDPLEPGGGKGGSAGNGSDEAANGGSGSSSGAVDDGGAQVGDTGVGNADGGELAEGGQVVPMDPTDAFAIDLSVGRDHACAVTRDGSVVCWGVGTGYRLGSGRVDDEPIPVVVPLVARAVQVSCGDSHTLMLSDQGEVYGWGENSYAELGDGTTTDRPKPVKVTALNGKVSALDSGGDHACVRMSDGSVSCWGYNVQQQVGSKTGRSHATPVDLGFGADELSSGGLHSCARQGGTLKCWGAGSYGQLGNDGTTTATATPTDVLDLTTVTQVSAGRRHTCAVASGLVYCWGDNEQGQVGDGTSGTSLYRPRPTAVLGLSAVQQVSAGGDDNPGGEHSCALLADGHVSCWGAGGYGQLGDGNTQDQSSPVQVLIDSVVQVAAGGELSCARREDGTVWCWGRGDQGRLGDGGNLSSLLPVRVAIPGP